jgi:all-trans-retinol 13,14-reductase
MYEMVATPTDPPLRFLRAGNCTPADRGECCSHDLAVGDLPVMHIREGLQQNRQELLSVFPNETQAIDKFLSYMEKAKYQSGIFSTLKMLPAWMHWILSQVLCSSYIHTASRSTEEILSPLTEDGRLHTVLSLFAGDLGESLGDGSFAMQAAVMGHVIEGCYYPESGPVQLVRGVVPPIRAAGGDVLVRAPVREILIEGKRAVGVRLGVGDGPGDCLFARRGVVSDAGLKNTLEHLLPQELVRDRCAPLRNLYDEVNAASEGAISHCFGFVGLNASSEELGLRSSSYYYLPWNETNAEMDATYIQDYYRDTLLDPNVTDVSAGWVFVTAKDPYYSSITMPGKTTVVIFSEAKTEDFEKFVDEETYIKGAAPHAGKARPVRGAEYEAAKELVKRKMMRGLLRCFPHLEPHVEVVEIGTPLSLLDYTHRMVTLGLRHNPRRLTSHIIRPDCAVPGLYFTGQDVCFAGWAGAMAVAMVTAQMSLGYNFFSLLSGKTLMRDLGAADVENLLKEKMLNASKTNPLEMAAEVIENAARHVQTRWFKNDEPPKRMKT